jgi:AAA family ATP:ADP antiporter
MPTVLAFVHFFLVIASYYIIKPVRDALFVKTIGPDHMPLFYLVVALVVFLVVALYNRLIQHFDSRRFTVGLQALVVVNILSFWALMAAGLRPSASFYIWASVYNVLLVTIFWSLTNDLFDTHRGRKYYGVVGGGGIVGGIVGGVASRYLPLWVGTTHCLLFAAALMVLAVGVTVARVRGAPAGAAGRSGQGGTSTLDDIRLVLADRHVRLIAQIVFFVTLAKTVFNYHYFHLVDAAIAGTDQAASFFGTVSTATNVSSAVLQFVVTTWVLRRFGARVGLVALPAVLLVALTVLIFPVALSLAAGLSVAQQSASYSINQSSKELLYTPCDQAVKYRAKAVIDMFVFRFGDAFAALVLLALHSYLGLPPWTSLAVGLGCTAYWLQLVLRSPDPTRE